MSAYGDFGRDARNSFTFLIIQGNATCSRKVRQCSVSGVIMSSAVNYQNIIGLFFVQSTETDIDILRQLQGFDNEVHLKIDSCFTNMLLQFTLILSNLS